MDEIKTALTIFLLRIKQVEEVTGLKRSTIYKKMSEGTFPKNYSLGGRSRAWKSCDIAHWIDECPRVAA